MFIISLLFAGFDRKLHARMQRRVGPPLTQPFYDFIKLMNKERIIPASASPMVFTSAAVLAATSSMLAASIVLTNLVLKTEFVGDILLVSYLLLMTAILTMLGGSSSGNPYGAIGFSRKMVMLFGYEVPLLVSLLLVAYKSGSGLSFYQIFITQSNSGKLFFASSIGASIATIVYLLCLPAAAGVVPFDIPEAKTEIVYGSLVEYGGPYLGLLKLGKEANNFTLSLLFFTLFMYLPTIIPFFPVSNVWLSILISLLGSFFVYFIAITIPRTVFARAKLRQALRFYAFVWVLSLISGVLLVIGI